MYGFQNQGQGFPGGFQQQNRMPQGYPQQPQMGQMGQMGNSIRQTSPNNFPPQQGQGPQQPKPMGQQGGPQMFQQGYPGQQGQQFPGQQRPGQPGQPGQPANYFSGGAPQQGGNFLNIPQNPNMQNSVTSPSPRGGFNPQTVVPRGPAPQFPNYQPGQQVPHAGTTPLQQSIQRSVQPPFQGGPQGPQQGQLGQMNQQGARDATSPNKGPVNPMNPAVVSPGARGPGQPGQPGPQGQPPYYNQQPGMQPHQQPGQNPLQYSNYPPGQNPMYPQQQGRPGYPQQGGYPQQPMQQQPPQQQQAPPQKAVSPPKQAVTSMSPIKESPGKGKKSVASEILSKAMLESKKSDMTYHSISKMSGSHFGTHSDANKTKFASQQEQQEHLDKLFDAANELEEERKVLAQLYEEEKMKECTFTPAILPGKASNKEMRGSSQFFEDMLAYKQAVEQKIQVLRDQIQEEVPTDDSHHPTLCAKSKALANKRPNGGVANVHERLYQEHTKKNKNVDDDIREFGRETVFSLKHYTKDGHVPTEADTFKPEIQEKSKGIARGEKVDDILYKDAKRRQNKTDKIMKAKPRPTEVYVSGNSQKVVASHFLKQFEGALAKYEGNKLSLLNMANLLHDLGYISPVDSLDSPTYLQENTLLTDMWIVLKGDATEGVTKRNLLAFMFAILGFNVPVPKWSENQGSPTKQSDIIVTNGDAHNGSEDPFFLACHKAVEDFFAAEAAKEAKKKGEKGKKGDAQRQDTSVRPTEKPEGTPENQIGWFDQEGDIYFSKEDVKKIQKVYDIFCINKLNADRGKNIKPRHTKDHTLGIEKPQPTFKPEILEYSKKLAEHHREKRKGEIMQLYEYHQQHKTGPDAAAPTTENQPAEGDIARENVEKIINSHAELMFFEKRTQKFNHAQQHAVKMEEEQKECTFKPKILEYKSPHEDDNEAADQGGDDEMKDIKRARKGITTKSLGKHRAFELYSLAKPAAQKRDRNADEIEYEKYCDECTFMPDVKSKSGNPEVSMKSGANNFMVRNEAQNIERLRKARETKEQIDYFKEKGYTLNAAIKIETTKFLHNEEQKKRADDQQRNTVAAPRGTQAKQTYQQEPEHEQEDKQVIYDHQEEDYGQRAQEQHHEEEEAHAESPEHKHEEQAQPTIPPSQEAGGEKGKDDRVPLLFVDVNLGEGKSERIVVYEGDQTEDLAQAFANEHNLDGEMKKRLKELLEKQIKGLLTRIEEEIPSLTSDDEIQSRRRMQQHLQASQQHH